MKLIVAGDSWTHGSELKDPAVDPAIPDWSKEHDSYRVPRVWPTKLGKLLNADEVVNLGKPAASNDWIVRNLTGWLMQEYISKGKNTSELFVVVGFTSPERKDFFYKGEKGPVGFWFTMWPAWKHKYFDTNLDGWVETYQKYLWNSEEYIHRYLHQVHYLQLFMQQYKINYLFFQAFYQRQDIRIRDWKDNPYSRDYQGQPDQTVWDIIDPIRFMHKNEEVHSFHNYLKTKSNYNDLMLNLHPSEQGHTVWAEHIRDYCKDNNIYKV